MSRRNDLRLSLDTQARSFVLSRTVCRVSVSAQGHRVQCDGDASLDEEEVQSDSGSGDGQKSSAGRSNKVLVDHSMLEDDDNEFERELGEWSKKVANTAPPGRAVEWGQQEQHNATHNRSAIEDIDDAVRSCELKQLQLLQELITPPRTRSTNAATRAPESGSEGGSMTM
jgi:hypothetical protein